MTEKIIVISGPSGSGKSTIAKALLSEFHLLEFSVSSTTRTKRAYETDGKDYYFISEEEFKQLISENEFVEYQEVYEHIFYGTTQSEIKRIINHHKIPLLDIDVLGAINIKKLYKEKALLIFIHPGNVETLKSRLLSRKTENPEMLKKRLDKAVFELSFAHQFDFVADNSSAVEDCIRTVSEIVRNFIESQS